MRDVCLLAPSLARADAMGNDVAEMHRALTASGITVHAFAEQWTSDLSFDVQHFDTYARHAQRADVVTIYQLATSWQRGAQQFLASRGSKVLRYHNITPAHFFDPYTVAMARACREGTYETEGLVASGRMDRFIADSSYNRDALLSLGAPRDQCAIVPPLHSASALLHIEATTSLLERYVDGICNVLFVGRVVPNKGHRHLLGVLAAYRRLFSRPIRLIVVGDEQADFAGYHEELRWLVRGLRLEDAVVWTGRVSDADLKAYFLLAHAFLIMSEHEGFCVPAVEAMALGTPLIAHAAGAVPETVGDAGIVIEGLDYDEYAAALELIFERPDVSAALITRGRERSHGVYGIDALQRQLMHVLQPLLVDPIETVSQATEQVT